MIDIVRKLKTKEHEDRLEKLELLAQMLKKQRKKFKLTLTKACEGICSVSYLSKMENNLLENVEEKFILKLCDRMKIDYNALIKHDDNYSLEVVAFDYLRGDFESIKQLYNSRVGLFDNVKSDIIKGYYFLINKKYDELLEVMGVIHELSSTMTASEYFMYILLVQEYYLQTFRINDALESFSDLYEIGCRFKKIDWLIDYQGLRIYFHNNDYMTFLKYYYKIVYIEDLLYPIEIQTIARLMKISMEIKSGNVYIIDKSFMNQYVANEYYADEINYLKLMILFNMKKYDEVKNFIIENNLTDEKFEVLYNWACYYTRGFKISEMKNDYGSYHNIFNKFLSDYYLVKESKIDSKDALAVLKEYKQFEEEYNHHLYNNMIFSVLADIYTSTTFYKEAMNYLKRKVSKIF